MPDLSVLIIDDNEVDAELLQRILERYSKDIEIDWCWDGLEALVRVGNKKPDLIFLDYMMPKTDGMDFLKNVRELKALKKTRIAVVSAFVEPGNIDKFIQLGADDVLAKPVQVKDVLDIVKKAEAQKKKAPKKNPAAK
jgi:CheY-like chemotaxis protein